MIKNILKSDVVHHMINIVLSWVKGPLPPVDELTLSNVSDLLNDSPTSIFKFFLLEKVSSPIKMIQFNRKAL
jgi:hypothetical protein